ncbi:hypothetical protein CPT_Muldoon_209 [Serratia phage Muldoon]|uniref:Uncharacterized protein n=1 Tax=Serratia phage Muldoon TaxID=2601678 RepID=A0A5P8PJC5_9CAUD|nr:hypothetical protein HYP94_gp181 [Serratia phage Muldoon]QFR56160.1 hypothetical protein CPT_Muldoon_209 [Serratia phage Muldoon]
MYQNANYEVILPMCAVGVLMAHINSYGYRDASDYRIIDMCALSDGRVALDVYSKYDFSDIRSLRHTLTSMKIEHEINEK